MQALFSQVTTSVVGADGVTMSYPSGLMVRNTFLDLPETLAGLDGLLEIRRAQSCPCIQSLLESESHVTSDASVLLTQDKDDAASQCSTSDSAHGSQQGRGTDGARSPTWRSESSDQSDGQELPSLGSMGHAAGDCRPCAFLHVRGCSLGTACDFCHLCPPGEKRRRQKEKRAYFCSLRAQGGGAAAAAAAPQGPPARGAAGGGRSGDAGRLA